MSKPDDKCCHIEIHIHSEGEVNIYNCSTPDRPSAGSKEDCRPTASSPGACVPLGLGAKPKQSQRRKLEKLLADNQVPSALAASWIHLSRRFVAGRPPANALEQSAFGMLQSLSPTLRNTLSCTLGEFDTMAPSERDRLFDATLLGDLDTPLDPKTLADAFVAELTQRTSLLAFDDPVCVSERPGKVRIFDPGPGETFFTQVRICRINGLRTANYLPTLNLSDYTLDELQQQCVPTLVNGEMQVNCSVQTQDCPGHFWSDGTCFRVIAVDAGQTVMLEGVNFFSVDATVRLKARSPGTETREVDAHVCGDMDTPLTETINGAEVLIADCRVHDRLTFQVPSDLPAGIYELYVSLPNITGIATFGPYLASNFEYLAVLPPSTARFKVVSERLYAHAETSPVFPGSDEVAVRFLTVGVKPDGTFCELQHVWVYYGDVDSGESRTMTCVPLPTDNQPLASVVMAIFGHEVDNVDAYINQIESFTAAYVDLLKSQWKIMTAYLALEVVVALAAMSGWPLVIAAVGIVLMLAIDVFLALWAPADLIMQDVIALSASDLAALTSETFPAPDVRHYVTAGDIKVKASPVSKGIGEYVESREYVSDDEESRYEITLRYTRVA